MRDLTNIPKRFHTLFTTDWNTGNESEMNSIQRGDMNNLFLEFNRWEVKNKIYNSNEDEEIVVGFEDLT